MTDNQFTQLKKLILATDQKLSGQITAINEGLAITNERLAVTNEGLRSTNERLTSIDERAAATDEKNTATFTKLFRYMSDRFDTIEAKLDTKADKADKADTDRIYDYIDGVIKKQEIDEQERLALSHQVDRHERWIEQVAEKTDTRPGRD